MGVKSLQLLFRLSRKTPEEPNESSSLIPKGTADLQKAGYGQGSGEHQCCTSGYCPPSDQLVESRLTSVKKWPPLLTHRPNLFIPLIKYFMFFFNFIFSVLGFAILGVGVWGIIDKQSLMSDKIGNLGTDPMLAFIILGLVVCVLAVSGCVGFLRENSCLLKLFSAGISALIIIQSVSAVVVLSFRDQIKDSVKSSMLVAVSRYQDDSDLRFIMDEIQLGMECCGVQSYQDWSINQYFNCSSPGVLSCGVPYSCCIDPVENGTVPNSQCGFQVLGMAETMAGNLVYLGGCVPQLSLWLNRKFWDIAAGFLIVTASELLCIVCAQRVLEEIKVIKLQW
ncbi:tetraspanin-10 [Spea bombifrons]|uniref:tetraspanin-10 n=1 Tax=Spea bombifrons TaxID=233779 RepID=UPI002349F73F|nr:tetraspanin-10 [Spea bombifrons]